MSRYWRVVWCTLLALLVTVSVAAAQQPAQRAGDPVNVAASCTMPAPNQCRIRIEPFMVPLQATHSLGSITIGYSVDADAQFEPDEPLLLSLVQNQDPAVRPLDDFITTSAFESVVECGTTGRVIVTYSYFDGSETQTAIGAGVSELLTCPAAGVPLAMGGGSGIALAGEQPWVVAALALLVLAAAGLHLRARHAGQG